MDKEKEERFAKTDIVIKSIELACEVLLSMKFDSSYEIIKLKLDEIKIELENLLD